MRETVDCAVYKFGQLLETPGIPSYSPSDADDGSENARVMRSISRKD